MALRTELQGIHVAEIVADDAHPFALGSVGEKTGPWDFHDLHRVDADDLLVDAVVTFGVGGRWIAKGPGSADGRGKVEVRREEALQPKGVFVGRRLEHILVPQPVESLQIGATK